MIPFNYEAALSSPHQDAQPLKFVFARKSAIRSSTGSPEETVRFILI